VHVLSRMANDVFVTAQDHSNQVIAALMTALRRYPFNEDIQTNAFSLLWRVVPTVVRVNDDCTDQIVALLFSAMERFPENMDIYLDMNNVCFIPGISLYMRGNVYDEVIQTRGIEFMLSRTRENGWDRLEREHVIQVVSTVAASMRGYPANEVLQRNCVSLFHSLGDVHEEWCEDDNIVGEIVPPVFAAMMGYPGNEAIQTQASEVLSSTVRVAHSLCGVMRAKLEDEEVQRACINALTACQGSDGSLDTDLEHEHVMQVVSAVVASMTRYPANEDIQRNGVSLFHSFEAESFEDNTMSGEIVPPVVGAMTRYPGNAGIQTQASELLRTTVRVAPSVCAYMRAHLENEEIQRRCMDVLESFEDGSLGDGVLEEEQLAEVVSTIGTAMTRYPANEDIQRRGVSLFHCFEEEREGVDVWEQIVPPVVGAMARYPANEDIQRNGVCLFGSLPKEFFDNLDVNNRKTIVVAVTHAKACFPQLQEKCDQVLHGLGSKKRKASGLK